MILRQTKFSRGFGYMKKLLTTTCLLGLVITMLTGCGTLGSSGSTLCTDDSILSKLKNDDSPEFVLDGVHYSLPASINEFYENGWVTVSKGFQYENILLQPNEYIPVGLAKGYYWFDILLANDSDVPLPERDEIETDKMNTKLKVVKIYMTVYDDELPQDFFVTKYGITTSTSSKDAKAVLRDKEGFSESPDGYYLTSGSDKGERDILYFARGDNFSIIRIESAEALTYSLYKSPEEKEEQ